MSAPEIFAASIRTEQARALRDEGRSIDVAEAANRARATLGAWAPAASQEETALRFAAPFEFEASPGGLRRIKGVAYSGDLLRHPYWGAVIFDLSTTEAPKPVPVLIEHDRAQRAGVCSLTIGKRIDIADGHLLANDAGRAVAAEADAGFPWQLSVHIEPREVQMLSAGESVDVNGRKVEGPAAVFRNSLIREVSFTPTGVDSNTSAAVFSTAGRAQASEVTDPHKFAAAVRAEQARVLRDEGREIDVIEAGRLARAATARGLR
jgi:hypothetical protein